LRKGLKWKSRRKRLRRFRGIGAESPVSGALALFATLRRKCAQILIKNFLKELQTRKPPVLVHRFYPL
jgi:hypothetical protein